MTKQQRSLLIVAAIGVAAAAVGTGYFWGVHVAQPSIVEPSGDASLPPNNSIESQVITPGQGFELSTAELERNSVAALIGDGEAAFRVYLHHNFAMGNAEEAGRWALIAAENGNWEGMSMVGHRLLRSKEVNDCRRAQYWIHQMHVLTRSNADNEQLGRALENLTVQHQEACKAS